jgi:choloylglycine hydrolase
MLYFFESALTPNTFWVDLKKVDFSSGAPVRRLDLGKDQRNTFSGEVSADFQPAQPFPFLRLDAGKSR